LLTATVTQVLSKIGENGRAAQAAKRLAIKEDLKGIGVDKTQFSCAVEGVSQYDCAAAVAILGLVASGASPDEIAAKIGLVVEVFEEQGIPLDDLLCDSYGEELEPEAQLEACREVVRQVQQAYSERGSRFGERGGDLTKANAALAAQREAQRRAHVAALVEAARADVEALAREAPCRRASRVLRPLAARADENALRLEHVRDDVLKLLVRKSEELRPGAEMSWIAIAEALNELGVPRKGGKEWDRNYVYSHYVSLQSNQTPPTKVEKRMIGALVWELGTEDRIPWAEILKRMGTGHSTNTVSNYWNNEGRYRYWVECVACKNWRLLEKGCPSEPNRCGACATCTAPRRKRRDSNSWRPSTSRPTAWYPRLPCLEPVVEGRWTCDCAKRDCTEPGDDALPETVEEAPAEAPADAAAVGSTPMALDDDNALQQPLPPDVVEPTAPPPDVVEQMGVEDAPAPAVAEAPEQDDDAVSPMMISDNADGDESMPPQPDVDDDGAASIETLGREAAASGFESPTSPSRRDDATNYPRDAATPRPRASSVEPPGAPVRRRRSPDVVRNFVAEYDPNGQPGRAEAELLRHLAARAGPGLRAQVEDALAALRL